MVLFDATMLSLMLHPGAKPPTDDNGQPILKARERVEHLIQLLDEGKTKIVIPTPALSELFVIANEAGAKYLELLRGRACFKIADFDQRAAVEAALQIQAAMRTGDKRQGSTSTWTKVKFDRQIVAIGKVEGVTMIYSDDEDIHRYSADLGIEAKSVKDLSLPPATQSDLFEGGGSL